jgi:hypothetical protein
LCLGWTFTYIMCTLGIQSKRYGIRNFVANAINVTYLPYLIILYKMLNHNYWEIIIIILKIKDDNNNNIYHSQLLLLIIINN